MAIDVIQINSQLQRISRVANFEAVTQQFNDVQIRFNALSTTTLGTQLNQIIGGIQTLSSTLQNGVILEGGVAQLTVDVTGISAQITREISSGVQSDVTSVIGNADDAAGAFLDITIHHPSVEGVRAAVESVTTVTTSQIQNILNEITPTVLQDAVKELAAIDNPVTDIVNGFTTTINGFLDSVKQSLDVVTGNLLKDLTFTIDLGPINILTNLGMSGAEARAILALIDSGFRSEAVDRIVTSTGSNPTEIENVVQTLEINLQDRIQTNSRGLTSSLPLWDSSSLTNRWNGARTSAEIFIQIPRYEDLVVEFIRNEREVTELIFCGQNTSGGVVTPAQIHESYSEEDGIPFHFLVQPNGNLFHCRPVAIAAEVAEGHTDYSINIVVPTSNGAVITPQQSRTVDFIIKAFYHVYPGGQVLSTTEIDPTAYTTGFDVDLYRTRYGKYNYGNATTSSTTEELIGFGMSRVEAEIDLGGR